jgi:DnaJ-class molecular chaperone
MNKPKEIKCEKCNGSGKIGSKDCSKCNGTGKVTLLLD